MVFLGIFIELLFIFSKIYLFFVLSTSIFTITSIYLIVKRIIYLRKTLYKVLLALSQGLISLLCIFLVFTAITPNTLVGTLQLFKGAKNSYTAPLTQEVLTDSGHLYINDIEYDTTYPNSFLDIYISNNDKQIRKPTVIMVHGGGYVSGDKIGEFGYSSEGTTAYINSFLDNGLNYVSINYALAPEYKYPTPLLQISKAIEFLQQDAVKNAYGIYMDSVIFTSVSAGGNIVGQFVNLQTNKSYAEEIKVGQVLSKEKIKAVIFNSALLDNSRYAKTGNVLTDFVFYHFGRAYLNCNYLFKNNTLIQSNVIENLSVNFPPCYISDGNSATFYAQAKDLFDKMNNLGLSVVFNDHLNTPKKVPHAYEVGVSKEAEENILKQTEFLKSLGIIL